MGQGYWLKTADETKCYVNVSALQRILHLNTFRLRGASANTRRTVLGNAPLSNVHRFLSYHLAALLLMSI